MCYEVEILDARHKWARKQCFSRRIPEAVEYAKQFDNTVIRKCNHKDEDFTPWRIDDEHAVYP